MEDIGFRGDAAFFDIMANQAIAETDRLELRKVADTYRQLARLNSVVPCRTRAEGWRFRAEECRTLAEQFTNAQCQAQLQRLATTYEKIADSHDAADCFETYLR